MRIFLSIVMLMFGSQSYADEARETNDHKNLSAYEIIEQVNARDDGKHVSRKLTIELTDRRGVKRVEKTVGYRKYFSDGKRTVLFYTEPSNVHGTGFLTFDYAEVDQDDDQWLYLPALRKVRRISSSNRGDYFLGTDLTYEEIKKENKIEISDYQFKRLGTEVVDGVITIAIEAIPLNDAIAKELGYSKVILHVDPEIWMSRQSDFWDLNGNRLKTVSNSSIELIDNIWTSTQVYVENHKTKHKTTLTFSEVDYQTSIDDDVFTQAKLRRGLR